MNWKRNLALVWLSQFFGLMGFGFAMPFVAYFIEKDLGVADPKACKMWTGIFMAAAPLTLAVMSPVWGTMADRYGRKLMMLRANLGAAVVLSSMGLAPTVEVLVLLRVVQGLLTGTVTAAQTLVASYTPDQRHGIALGSLSAAIFAGNAAGGILGGLFAEEFGYRKAFFMSGILLVISALFVLMVTERFERPAVGPRQRRGLLPSLPNLGAGGPILVLILAMAAVRQYDAPVLPFLVKHIVGGLEGASLWNGRVLVAFSLGAVFSGFVLGRAADRFRPTSIAVLCAAYAGLCVIPQANATGFPALVLGRFGMAFFAAGLDPIFQAWLARVTPPEKRGAVFGWAVTAKSTGWIVGPLASSAIGAWFGIRAALFTAAVLYAGLIPVIHMVARRVARRNAA